MSIIAINEIVKMFLELSNMILERNSKEMLEAQFLDILQSINDFNENFLKKMN